MDDWIRGELAELRHLTAFRKITSQDLDDDGLPTELMDCLDRLLCEDAVRKILEWPLPTGLPVGRLRDDKWRTVSSLQKAIRRGDVWAAMSAAHAAYGMDPRYLFRRLVVCAIEDVLLGNLYGVAVTLALAGNYRSRRIAGDRKVAVWLAALLASGFKDRTACNLCVVVDYDRNIHPLMRDWTHRPDADLAGKATDLSRPVEERMLAAWLLAGTKRYWNLNVPTSNDRPRWSLMRLMIEGRMPLILYYIADRAAIRGGDCMFVALLPLWQMLEAGDDPLQLRQGSMPNDPGIGPLLACAYDMHTRDGRTALQHFAGRPVVASAIDCNLSPEDRFSALCAAVFAVEGGVLNARISSPEIDRIHVRAVEVEHQYYGLRSDDERRALMRAVQENLSALHDVRREVVASIRPSETIECVGIQPHNATIRELPSPPTAQLTLPLHQAPKPAKRRSPPPLPEIDLLAG